MFFKPRPTVHSRRTAFWGSKKRLLKWKASLPLNRYGSNGSSRRGFSTRRAKEFSVERRNPSGQRSGRWRYALHIAEKSPDPLLRARNWPTANNRDTLRVPKIPTRNLRCLVWLCGGPRSCKSCKSTPLQPGAWRCCSRASISVVTCRALGETNCAFRPESVGDAGGAAVKYWRQPGMEDRCWTRKRSARGIGCKKK